MPSTTTQPTYILQLFFDSLFFIDHFHCFGFISFDFFDRFFISGRMSKFLPRKSEGQFLGSYSIHGPGAHHPLSPVIKLGLRYTRKKGMGSLIPLPFNLVLNPTT